MNLFKNMKRRTVVIGAAAMLLISITGAAYALYGGKSNNVTHEFSIRPGESDKQDAGTLEDTAFDPTKTTDLLPGAVITSQPSLTSNVDYDADYVIKVEQPVIKAQTALLIERYYPALYEEYSHDLWGAAAIGKLTGLKEGDTYVCYYEGRNPIKPGETISSLFDFFKVEDFYKIDSKFNGNIQITAYMRQHTDQSLTDHTLLKSILQNDGRELEIDELTLEEEDG